MAKQTPTTEYAPQRAIPRTVNHSRRRRMEAMALIIAALLGFLSFSFTWALWSSTSDGSTVVIQSGDLSVAMNDGYTWQTTVWTNPDNVPPGMEYDNPDQIDESTWIGETSGPFPSTKTPVLMGGDWMTLDVTFTGVLTKIGDNLIADVTVIPRADQANLPAGLTYTLDVTGTSTTSQPGQPVTVRVPASSAETMAVTVTVHITGDQLGIHPQVSHSAPQQIVLDHLFDIKASQVRYES